MVNADLLPQSGLHLCLKHMVYRQQPHYHAILQAVKMECRCFNSKINEWIFQSKQLASAFKYYLICTDVNVKKLKWVSFTLLYLLVCLFAYFFLSFFNSLFKGVSRLIIKYLSIERGAVNTNNIVGIAWTMNRLNMWKLWREKDDARATSISLHTVKWEWYQFHYKYFIWRSQWYSLVP